LEKVLEKLLILVRQRQT